MRNEKKKSSRPRNLCAVQGHSRQQTSVFHLVSSSSFLNLFCRCFSATGVCVSATVFAAWGDGNVWCSCFVFLDWLRNHHALECERGRMWADVQFVIRNVHTHTHTHFRLLEETPSYYHPHREGGTSLTSPGGHLTSFSQSGILLKPTVATAAAGHVFKRFSS